MKTYNWLLPIFMITASIVGAAEKNIPSLQEEYDLSVTAYQKKDWKNVIAHAKTVKTLYPNSLFLSDLSFFTAVAYFHQKDYDLANEHFSEFLEKYATPNYFEDAILYKYQIAENFEMGKGKHLLGWKVMPKIVSGWEDAYQIYDEVINTLSRHEVAAKALFRKANMLRKDHKYPESIETYQAVVRKFPKHPLAPESYLAVAAIYLEESRTFFADRDFLEQARLNLKKFGHDFPREERLIAAETMLRDMMDRYAKDLWESATYYQKKNKMLAANLYYQSILKKYPESHFVEPALAKLEELKKVHPEMAEAINASVFEPQQ